MIFIFVIFTILNELEDKFEKKYSNIDSKTIQIKYKLNIFEFTLINFEF